MAKSLRSMSESERKAAIARRLASKTMGLGYWAARGAAARLTKHAPDAVESDALNSIFHTSEVSASEADSTPATTQVM